MKQIIYRHSNQQRHCWACRPVRIPYLRQ